MTVAGYTTIATFATALVTTLVAFGFDLSERQIAALLGLVGAAIAAAPLVSGWFTRGRVYAPATVAKMIDQTVAETREEVHAELPTHTRWPAGEM